MGDAAPTVAVRHTQHVFADGVLMTLRTIPGVRVTEGEADILLSDRPSSHPHQILITEDMDASLLTDLLADRRVRGLLHPASPNSSLVCAVEAVRDGLVYVDPRWTRLLLGLALHRKDDAGVAAGLTRREADVLELLADGLSTRETADVLSIAVETVRKHVQAIYRKLGVSSRAEAIEFAHRIGLTGPGDRKGGS